MLYTAQGRVADAVPYTLAGLAIQLEIDSPDAATSVHWLGRQREIVGDTAFRAILADLLSADDVESVVGLLDSAATDNGTPPVDDDE